MAKKASRTRGRTEAWLAGDGGPVTVGAGTNEWGGNLRVEGRPVLLRRTPEGLIDGYSTTASTIVPMKGGGYAVIPTVVDGQDVGEDGALRRFRETGEHWGRAATFSGAQDIAESVHDRSEELNREAWSRFASGAMEALSPDLRSAMETGDLSAVRQAAKGGRAVRRRWTPNPVSRARYAQGWYQDTSGNWRKPGESDSWVQRNRWRPNVQVVGGRDNADYDKELKRQTEERRKQVEARREETEARYGGLLARTDMKNRAMEHAMKAQAAVDARNEAEAARGEAEMLAEAERMQRRDSARRRVADAEPVSVAGLAPEDQIQSVRNALNFNSPGHAAATNRANAAARRKDPEGAAHLMDYAYTDPAAVGNRAAHNQARIIASQRTAGIGTAPRDVAASTVKFLERGAAAIGADAADAGAKRMGKRAEALDASAKRLGGIQNRFDEMQKKLKAMLADIDASTAKSNERAQARTDRAAVEANPVGTGMNFTGKVYGTKGGKGVHEINPEGPFPGKTGDVDDRRPPDNPVEVAPDAQWFDQDRMFPPGQAAAKGGRSRSVFSRRAAVFGGNTLKTGTTFSSGPRTTGVGTNTVNRGTYYADLPGTGGSFGVASTHSQADANWLAQHSSQFFNTGMLGTISQIKEWATTPGRPNAAAEARAKRLWNAYRTSPTLDFTTAKVGIGPSGDWTRESNTSQADLWGSPDWWLSRR